MLKTPSLHLRTSEGDEIWEAVHQCSPDLHCLLFVILYSGRGARVSACTGLINQLQRCRFESLIACLENSDTAIEGERGWGLHHALYC